MLNESTQRAYRVGIVGAGGIAQIHADVLTNRLSEADLVAICDISQETISRFGDKFNVPGRYLDLAEMLDNEELDIVIVCNWGIDHAQTTIQIAKSRKVKAILCEKPLAMNTTEAEEMVAVAAETDVLLVEAFKFRHHPMHLKAKEMVDNGAIGDVFSIRSTLITGRGSAGSAARTPESNWRFNKAKGGGSINDIGCYCLAQARFIYGTEPMRLFAHSHIGIEVDDRAAVLLVFPENRIAQFTVGFHSWPSQVVEINGTDGSLHMDKPWNNSDEATALTYQSPEVTTVMDFTPRLQYTDQLHHLCECLSTGQPHRIPPQDSINQQKVLDAITESMATGRVIDL
ncbi:MAG: Gfo/Idh/MocA family oxidoreductase [Chloroflexota bacterium]